MIPRKHQIEAMSIVDEIMGGADIKDILFKVTPGGGKSAIPIIFGKLIEAGKADAICWICPRRSLQNQGESNFQDPFFRKMFNHKLSIRTSTNDVNPCRGLNGFVTTYQAVGLDEHKTVLREIKSKRYILILDEFHHAEQDSLWEEALRPIYEAAAFRVKMTGTLERNSGKKIAFTRYVKTRAGIRPLLTHKSERVVSYTRQDALAEKAIIPLRFFFNDASVEWEEEGQRKKYSSLRLVPSQDKGKALYTAIQTDYAKELMEKALAHWMDHRKINPTAKMLVVSPDIKTAKTALEYLKSRYHYSRIATSKDNDEATESIKAFKSGEIQILVGVAMFYEGFDAPEVSHIVSLTNIRSTPWIEQMLARAVRVNKNLPYHLQYGFIFTADDPLMHDIVLKIQAEQLPYIKADRPATEQMGLFDEPKSDGEYKPFNIEPVGSALTSGREFTLGDQWPSFGQVEYEGPCLVETPSETEDRLRREIEKSIRTFCQAFNYKEQEANCEVKIFFGKSRADMTIPELEQCLGYVRRTYAAHGTNRRRAARRAERYYG